MLSIRAIVTLVALMIVQLIPNPRYSLGSVRMASRRKSMSLTLTIGLKRDGRMVSATLHRLVMTMMTIVTLVRSRGSARLVMMMMTMTMGITRFAFAISRPVIRPMLTLFALVSLR
jgi:hypothetical protein